MDPDITPLKAAITQPIKWHAKKQKNVFKFLA
jgi:hypothetical protein